MDDDVTAVSGIAAAAAAAAAAVVVVDVVVVVVVVVVVGTLGGTEVFPCKVTSAFLVAVCRWLAAVKRKTKQKQQKKTKQKTKQMRPQRMNYLHRATLYWVSLDGIGIFSTFPSGCTGFYQVWMGFTVIYRVLPSFTEFY